MYGNDFVYAASRLVDSIVRLSKSGEPIYIEHVDVDSGKVRARMVKNQNPITASLDELNFKPVPLGWCNVPTGATYLARIPKRQDWRQGIRAQTCFSSMVRFQNIPFASLAACIKGEYPKFKELIVKQWKVTTAWSRKWASDSNLLYFGNLGEVGSIVKGQPVLKDEFIFLKESLEKSLS